MCAALGLIYSAVMYLEQNSVSCWQRCLWRHWFQPGACILMWQNPHNHRECDVLSDACLHLSYAGQFTSLSLSRCLFKWHFPVSSPVNILSWFLWRWSNFLASPPLPQRVVNENHYLAFTHIWTANAVHESYLSSPWSYPWQPLQIYQAQAQVLLVVVRSPVWLIHHLSHFHQFPCVLVPLPVGSTFAIFTVDWWNLSRIC
jgi:hypothetical protein